MRIFANSPAESFVATETSAGSARNFKDDTSPKEPEQFHFNSSLNGFFQGAIVLVVPERHGRYTRYNVISSLNDHVETNRGKTEKKKVEEGGWTATVGRGGVGSRTGRIK